MSDKKTEATEKPLEKMTVKALREIAKEIPEELLVAINEVRGVNAETAEADPVPAETVKADKVIKAKPVKKTGSPAGEIKKQIKALKAQRQAALETQDRKMATVYKRRISRLKKQSRKAAA